MNDAGSQSDSPFFNAERTAASSSSHVRKTRPSRRKRLMFAGMSLVVGLVSAELLALAGLHLMGHSLASLHDMQEALARYGVSAMSSREVMHPYLGWVLNPQTHQGEAMGGRQVRVNALGLLDENLSLPRRSHDRLIVAVLGGSVAWQMTVAGEQRLLQTLAARPETTGREIVLLRLALSAYKQPQQLMSLNYALTLGAEFDVVVNVDGFNEIALTTCQNHPSRVFLAYPWRWHERMLDVVDPREYGLTFRLLEARANRQLTAKAITKSPLRWSPTRNLIWLLQQRHYESKIGEIGTELTEKRGRQGRGFHSSGPDQLYDPDDEDALFRHAVELWANGSRQLDHLCSGNGAVYVHVLQPNQYVPNSKPMSPDERENTIDEESGYAPALRRGYPLLIASGAALRAEGIRFTDLTMLFSETKDWIYSDSFCHYNQLGNDLLAEAVANLVADALAAREQPRE